MSNGSEFNVLRLDKYNQEDHLWMTLQYNDGKYPWRCEQCRQWQHPDHEMMRSIYYKFSESDGPNFCGYHCMMDYRDYNDYYRFSDEKKEENKTLRKKLRITKKQWLVKNKAENLLLTATQKQKDNILNALRTQLPTDSETPTESN